MTMQGPIISPWIFYLAELSECTKALFLIGGIVTLMLAVFWFALAFDDSDFDSSRPFAKRIAAVSILAILIGCVIPGKNTCLQMIAAHYLTYENVDAVGGQAKEVVDYIFDKVDEVTEDES